MNSKSVDSQASCHEDQSDPRRYISESEAALRYPYSRYWFQRKRWEGDGPPFLKIGNRIMYPIPEIDEWFRAQGLYVDDCSLSPVEPQDPDGGAAA
jgi:predicted DNA-binding transcriptional regulator AlpA